MRRTAGSDYQYGDARQNEREWGTKLHKIILKENCEFCHQILDEVMQYGKYFGETSTLGAAENSKNFLKIIFRLDSLCPTSSVSLIPELWDSPSINHGMPLLLPLGSGKPLPVRICCSRILRISRFNPILHAALRIPHFTEGGLRLVKVG